MSTEIPTSVKKFSRQLTPKRSISNVDLKSRRTKSLAEMQLQSEIFIKEISKTNNIHSIDAIPQNTVFGNK
jgi:hypothetical protein